MVKRKLAQFKEFSEFPNTLEFDRSKKGKWKEEFGNNNPIVAELACGYGHYASVLGKANQGTNYIGVDRKGNRMWHGAKWCIDEKVDNVRFLRTPIEFINEYFAPGELQEIWITFPDPQPKDKTAKNRLTHPLFLRRYQELLNPDGIIHLKTDSDLLYRFTRAVIKDCQLPVLEDRDDIYNWEERPSELDIKTYYEDRWLKEGKRIKYLRFKLRNGAFDHIDDFRKYDPEKTSSQ